MWFYRRSFRHSRKIFTVSAFSKSRIEHYSRNSVPVIVTFSAIQPFLLKHQNTLKKEYIVFIGNIKKHKGLDILLDAFLEARRDGLDYKLVIIGNKDNFRSWDESFDKKIKTVDPATVEFTGFISDNALAVLLSEAALLIQPSLYEGFCLPPLEAMTVGTRALISDISALKEIYGDFPVTFFRAGDSTDLKKKLMSLLCNKKPEPFILPVELAEKYTFKKTSAIILRELEKS
jgi:glycosyltransferase involved in cell wall biosynthesis